MTSATSIARAREAMSLRRAVLPLLAGATPTSDELEVLRAASAAAWQLMTSAECCALPLSDRLRSTGLLALLPPEARSALSIIELQEMQRVMAARAELRLLDSIAVAHDVEIVVLKGGAVVAEQDRAPLDLGDVDLLTSRDGATKVWQALIGGGWAEKEVAGLSAIEPENSAFNHFVPLLPPDDGIAVELHQRVRYDAVAPEKDAPLTTRALKGHQALRRPIGAAAVVQLLEHSVIHHPHRRGHLRDLALLADGLHECSESERATLPSRLDGLRFGPEMREMLGLAEAFARGDHAMDSDSMRRAVARKYLLVLGAEPWRSSRIPAWWQLSSIGFERSAIRSSLYADLLRSAFTAIPPDSRFRARGLARHAPRVVRAAGWSARAAYRTGLTVLVAASGPAVRRGIDAVLRPEPSAR
jgi:hypothetical protein